MMGRSPAGCSSTAQGEKQEKPIIIYGLSASHDNRDQSIFERVENGNPESRRDEVVQEQISARAWFDTGEAAEQLICNARATKFSFMK